MTENRPILFVINRHALSQWTMYFKEEYHLTGVDVIDFRALRATDNKSLERYSLIIVCIEKYTDFLIYKLCKDREQNIPLIHLLDINKKLFRRRIPYNKILYKTGSLKESVAGLLNVVKSDNAVSLDYKDVLYLAGESELLCLCLEGNKEKLLSYIADSRKTLGTLSCCLVNIVGDISLIDVNEIVSSLQNNSDSSLIFGC